MKFNDAIVLLEVGHKIHRTCWEKGHYWVFNKKINCIVDSKDEPPRMNLKQLVADDWEEYKEEQSDKEIDKILILAMEQIRLALSSIKSEEVYK